MNNWRSIQGHFNYDQFLVDKGIKSYLNDLPESLRQNRVYFGRFKKNEGEKLDADLVQDGGIELSMINMGNSVVLPKNMFWDDLYGVIFTSKSFKEDLLMKSYLGNRNSLLV